MSESRPSRVRFVLKAALRLALDQALGKEAYRLSVTPAGVRITAGIAAGAIPAGS